MRLRHCFRQFNRLDIKRSRQMNRMRPRSSSTWCETSQKRRCLRSRNYNPVIASILDLLGQKSSGNSVEFVHVFLSDVSPCGCHRFHWLGVTVGVLAHSGYTARVARRINVDACTSEQVSSELLSAQNARFWGSTALIHDCHFPGAEIYMPDWRLPVKCVWDKLGH
jgi:hypothetical protein